MSKLTHILASLLLAGAAGACAPSLTSNHAATKPVPVQPAVQLDRAKLRAKLAARREVVVQRFLAYREGRVYPINNLPGGGFRHVWIDDTGNLCAAATLVSRDWGRDAAIEAMQGNREIKLADVKSGPLADWILTSGLTHAEIVSIQVPGFDPCDGGRCRQDETDPRRQEVDRLYGIYIDVERQIRSLWDENLDAATDALMKRPDLARAVLNDRVAGPGRFAKSPVG
ncbi:MAG TPA: hypothetical protein VFQ53_08430 [Kofleriaceae bacterium]|nr:hypothetical protein [Kofleriaceae bacterium]